MPSTRPRRRSVASRRSGKQEADPEEEREANGAASASQSDSDSDQQEEEEDREPELGTDSDSESDSDLRTPHVSSAERRERILKAARSSPIAALGDGRESPFALPYRSELPQYRFAGLKLAKGSPEWWSRNPRLVRPADGRGSEAPPDAEAKKRARERRETTLFRRPFRTLAVCARVVSGYAAGAARHVASHRGELLALVLAVAAVVALHVVPGLHSAYLPAAHWAVRHVAWWVGLGILSSVGLGTGLHTFLLYLGPHIAQVAMAAVECGTLDFETEGEFAYKCPEGKYKRVDVAMADIVRAVALPAFLWGLGTALGELPPYFIARAARAAGAKLDELQELERLEDADRHGKPPKSWAQRSKVWVLEALESYGFFAIVLLASVPNPLFDLAGLACGSLGVPLATFLGATFVGKALIKVFLQSAFVALMFGSRQIEQFITSNVSVVLPSVGAFLHEALEKQRAKYHEPHKHQAAHEATWFAHAWNTFLFLMIGSFVVSIVNSVAQGRLADEEAERRRRRVVGARFVS